MKVLSEILENYLNSQSSILNLKNEVIDENKFGYRIDLYNDTFSVESIVEYDIALIGVGDDRNTLNKTSFVGVNLIRKRLYDLYSVNENMKVLDLGNVKTGATIDDTYFALKDILKELRKVKVIPVVIGVGHDFTYAQYMSYSDANEQVNLTVVDSKLDLGSADSEMTSLSYLSKIILENGEHLFKYTNIGYQRYLVPQSNIDMMSRLYFDTYRLGEIQEDIAICEPVLRDSNIVSFDMSAVRMSESPGCKLASPNGLFGNEACQVGYYSGLGDNVSSFGIYEFNPDDDINGSSAQLASQIIWYFIDGFYQRRDDILDESKTELKKFSVEVTVSDHKIVFLHSPKTNRWWIIVPSQAGSEANDRFVSCSSDDYKMAVNGELPDKWWKTYQLIV